jgi:hypothetical protein
MHAPRHPRARTKPSMGLRWSSRDHIGPRAAPPLLLILVLLSRDGAATATGGLCHVRRERSESVWT